MDDQNARRKRGQEMKARLKIEQEISEKMDKECKMKEEFYFDSEQEGEEEEEEEEKKKS